MVIPVRLLVLSALLVGAVLLQLYLSGRESGWPGLVLPILAFLFSFLAPLNMMAPPEGVTAGFVLRMILVWLSGNIPTAVLLAVYFARRDRRRRKKQLEKMNIQDLG